MPEHPNSVSPRGHPRGLYVLIGTETWAWFSYFGLQALLVFYMTKELDFSQPRASAIYGAYTGAAFFTPFLGGLVADRWLGQRRSILSGGSLMAAGHFLMMSEALLFPALALVAIGNGLFVPPLTAQVARLYGGDTSRSDRGYSLYYVGVNVGSFAAPLVCGTLGERVGWHFGFGVAGAGMLLALVIYLAGARLLPSDPVLPARRSGGRRTLDASDVRAIRFLVGIALLVVLFRVPYEQSGNTIALWIDQQTDRRIGTFLIPATWFQSINPALIILGTPVITAWWARSARRGREPDTLIKMAIGCGLAGGAYLLLVAATALHPLGQPVHWGWTVGYFLLLTAGELHVLPIGIALFSRRSPAQVVSAMIGVWYLAKFLGSVAAGLMGTFWPIVGSQTFFLAAAVLSFTALLIFRLLHVRLAKAV